MPSPEENRKEEIVHRPSTALTKTSATLVKRGIRDIQLYHDYDLIILPDKYLEGQTREVLAHNMGLVMDEYNATGKIGDVTPKNADQAREISIRVAEVKAYGFDYSESLLRGHSEMMSHRTPSTWIPGAKRPVYEKPVLVKLLYKENTTKEENSLGLFE
jgi:hypothetical protein